MKRTGRKHGTNKILTFKRGGKISPLFLLYFSSSLLLFNEYGYAQFYSSKLFPGSVGTTLNGIKKPEYSITTFYDHTYEHTLNDTTVSHIYKAMVYQYMSLPLKNNSILTIGHRYNDFYTGYKSQSPNQHLYNKQKYHSLNLGYGYYGKWYNLHSHYSFSPDNDFRDIKLSLTIKYRNYTLQPEYQSWIKTISGSFISNTMSYDVKNFTNFNSYGLKLGYHSKRFSGEFKMISRLPSSDTKINNEGLGLNIGTARVQYDSGITYNLKDHISIWSAVHYYRDTCEVPIYWKDSKLGEFTAIDDTLWTGRIGISLRHQKFALGLGNWSGKTWISQLSPHPFTSVWAVLSGTKYYLDMGSDMRLFGMFYSNQWQNRQWQGYVHLNLLKFSGSLYSEQWAITFPFITTLHDRLDIQIHRLIIMETNIGISKKVTTDMKIKFWSNILLPIDLNITTIPEAEEHEKKEGEKISGGMQFGISFNYLLNGF